MYINKKNYIRIFKHIKIRYEKKIDYITVELAYFEFSQRCVQIFIFRIFPIDDPSLFSLNYIHILLKYGSN